MVVLYFVLLYFVLIHNAQYKIDLFAQSIAGNYTMEVIASTGFGIQLNTQKDKNHPFIYYAKMAFDVSLTSFIFLVACK